MVAECSPPGRSIPRPRFDNKDLGLGGLACADKEYGEGYDRW